MEKRFWEGKEFGVFEKKKVSVVVVEWVKERGNKKWGWRGGEGLDFVRFLVRSLGGILDFMLCVKEVIEGFWVGKWVWYVKKRLGLVKVD